jgi:hypothetical protein
VGIGFWFRNTGSLLKCECHVRAFGLIEPPFPEPVFKDMEVVLEGLGSLVRINVGREYAGIICKCG